MGNKILSKHSPTGFNQEQLAYLQEKFQMLSNQQGFLDQGKFAEAFKCTQHQAKQAFKFIDFTDTGLVDFYQFKCCAANFCLSDIQDTSEMIFQIYGKKDGKISEADLEMFTKTTFLFNDFVEERNPLTQQGIKVLNRESEIKLDPQESSKVELKRKQIKQLNAKKLKKWDYDHTGELSKTEFHNILTKDPDYKEWMYNMGFISRHKFLCQTQDDCDSDLENQTQKYCREIDEEKEKIKHGIQHGLQQDQQDLFGQVHQKGDQSGASPSWIKTAQYMVPSSFEKGQALPAPDTQLQIEYVYGYRCHDTRQNLKYGSKGQVVYHTAGVGINLNPKTNKQIFNLDHVDDITCIDVYQGLACSGEMGSHPLIIVWDIATCQTKYMFKGDLEKSIGNVCFSNDGKLIAANSLDDDHHIAIYSLEKAQKIRKQMNRKQKPLLALGKGTKSIIFSLKFSPNNDTLVAGCHKEVLFFSIKNGIRAKKGIFGKSSPMSALCLCFNNNDLISGMMNGCLLIWKGNSCSGIIMGHTQSVDSLAKRVSKPGIISGSKNGIIKIWDNNMKQQRVIQLASILTSNSLKIIALCQNKSGKLLCGLRGGQIYELTSQTKEVQAKLLIQGHFNNELWGLTVHPKKSQFYTLGQDKLLMHWDIKACKLLRKKLMNSITKFVDISPDGMLLAIGFKNGVVEILKESDFSKEYEIKEHKNPDKEICSLVKFSPNGNILAIGYAPPISKVYLFNTKDFKSKFICKGSPSRIFQLDFSQSSSQIQVNNTSYQILFFSALKGQQIRSGSTLKDEKWATFTCGMSWRTRGIWPPCSDGSDINAVDRSNNQRVIATGDDFSKVKLFRNPACLQKQAFNIYKGHSSHITSIKFTNNDQYLISTGGAEKSIIQWKVIWPDQVVELVNAEEEGQQELENKEDEDLFQEEEGEGDQALAIKPFVGQVIASTPEWYKPNPARDNKLPLQSLKLVQAYGIKNQYIKDQVRNQCRYSNDKDFIVFPTACLGVVMNKKTRQQTFFNQHKEDIVSFAVDKTGTLCATGQMAQRIKNKKNKIVEFCVWDIKTKQLFCRFEGFHVAAIVLLEFSPDGTRILSAGQDDNNSIAVYDWKSQAMLWSGKSSRGKINACAFKNNDQFITCGNTEVRFWNKNKGRMGKLSCKWEAMFSAAYFQNVFITGSGLGNLFVWNGTSSGKAVKGHQGKVQCFHIFNNSLLSGGSDGSIKMWKIKGGSVQLEKIFFDMSKSSAYDSGILSIDSAKDLCLIVTQSSEIFQINGDKASCIMKSHFAGELWGCCTSPKDHSFLTAGDDKTVRLWSIPEKKMVCGTEPFKQQVRGVDWASNGNQIVVGDNVGHLFLLDGNLKLVDQFTSIIEKGKKVQSKYWIEEIKFSPDCGYVAFGAHGTIGYLEIVQIVDKKFQGSKLIKNVGCSTVLNLDWDINSSLIVAVSQDYFLKFLNIAGLNDTSASSCKEVEWASWSCKFGFPVQGIWQGVDYTDINSVSRNKQQSCLATGNDDQVIRLFNYPVVVDKQVHKQYYGHSSHITKVRFTFDDCYLVSTGGNDRTAMVWKVEGKQQIVNLFNFSKKSMRRRKRRERKEKEQKEENQKEKEQKEQIVEEEEDEFDQEDLGIDYPRERVFMQEQDKIKEDQLFGTQENQGDQFMAIKPWLGAIKAPDSPMGLSQQNSNPPEVQLNLQYVYGYRTKDCRSNCKYLQSENTIIYHAAAIAIVHHIKQNRQEFFKKHIDDIISMALHPNKIFVVTGQIGPKPNVYMWDSSTMKVIQYWKGPVKKGVCALAFSTNGKFIAGAAMDDDHYVCVLDAENGTVIYSQKGGREVILEIGWHSDQQFISIGIKHYKQWSTKGKLKQSKGIFGKNSNQICSISIDQNFVITGAGNGNLYKWQGTSIIKTIKVHEKALQAITTEEKFYLTGGKDGKVCVINRASFELVNQFNMADILHSSRCSNVRSLDLNRQGTRLLLGTMGSQIYELRVDDLTFKKKNSLVLEKVIMESHYAPNLQWLNQVWGLAIAPDNKHFYTCSDDATLRLWDLSKRKMISSCSLNFTDEARKKPDYQKNKKYMQKPDIKTKDYQDNAKGRCVAVCPSNGSIAVGCKDGSLRIFDKDLVPTNFFKAANKQISDIKFSPDGTMLVVGSHDAHIYVYDYSGQKFKLKYKAIKKHSSYITHIDFSMDGNFIHSTCGAYQLLFFQLNMGKQLTSGASALRNEKWFTWTATLGWPVQGIWPQCTDGTHINSVDRSHQTINGTEFGYYLLASGDDWGKLRVLRYPSIQKSSKAVEGKGHSSHVTKVSWSVDDKRIITTGGQDQCVMQWLVQKQK